VGTHFDLCTLEHVDKIGEERKILFPMISEFVAISCINEDTITHLRETIIHTAKKCNLIGRKIPRVYNKIRKELAESETALLSTNDFINLLDKVFQ